MRVQMTLKDEPITIESDDDEPEERSKTINAMLPPPPPPALPGIPSSRTSGVPSRRQQQKQQHGTPCSVQSSMATHKGGPKVVSVASLNHVNVVSSTSASTTSPPSTLNNNDGGRPHLLTDSDLLSLITDLELPNDRAVILIDRLSAWRLIDSRSVLIAGKRPHPSGKVSPAASPMATPPVMVMSQNGSNGGTKRFKHQQPQHQLC